MNARHAARLVIAIAAALFVRGALADDPKQPRAATVLDEADVPVADVEVVAVGVEPTGMAILDDEAPVLAHGGSAGRVVPIPSAPAPRSRVAVRSAGRTSVLVPAGESSATLRMARGSRLAARVTLADGKPVVAATVEARPSAPGDLGFRTTTDDQGAFLVGGAAAVDYALRVRRGTGAWQDLGRIRGGVDGGARTFVAGGTVLAELREPGARPEARSATRGMRVRLLRLLDFGTTLEPDAAATVPDATSGETGALDFRDVPPGVYEAVLDDERWAFDGPAPRVESVRADDKRVRTWFVRRRGGVVGTVVDESGAPVASARVVAVRPTETVARRDGWGAGSRATTGPDGRFRVDGLVAADGWWLTITHAERPAVRAGPVTVVPGRDADVVRVPMPKGWAIGASVRDTEGRPVAGADVLALPAARPLAADAKEPFGGRGKTDAEGRATVGGLPLEDAILVVSKAGFLRSTVSVPRDAGRSLLEVRVPLAAAPVLRVRLLSRAGDVPPVDVGARLPDGTRVGRAEPREEDSVVLADLPSGRFDVEVARPGASGSPDRLLLARVEDVLPTPGQDLVIEVPATYAVSGVVRGVEPAKGGSAVLEALRRPREREPDEWFVAARTTVSPGEPEGAFRFEGIPPGAYRLRVTQGLRDSGAIQVVVESADVERVEAVLPAAGRIEGRVVDSLGRRAALGAHVALVRLDVDPAAPRSLEGAASRPPAIADDDGRFVFADVLPGTWRVAAGDEDRAPAVAVARVAEGQTVEIGSLTLAAGGTIDGLVRDPNGRALRGVGLEAARRPDFDVLARVSSGEDGRFRLDRLPAGRYRVRVVADSTGPSIEAEVEVVEGATTSVELGAGGEGLLAGTVRRRGVAVPGIDMEAVLSDSGGADRLVRRATADAFGKFRFESLPPGRYTLRTLEGGVALARRIFVREGDRVDRDVDLGEGRIAGSVRRAGGDAVRDAEVVAYPTSAGAEDAVGRALTGPDGRFQIAGLPVGLYRVDVSPPGRPMRSIEGVFAEVGNAGRPLDVVLSLGARLELRVVDEGRRGVAGAEVWIEDAKGDALHTRAFLTAATGRTRIEGLPEGDARVRVRARGFGMPPVATVRLREGGTAYAEVVLRPAASLVVRVYAGRDVVSRARVDVERPNGERVVLRRTARWVDPAPLGWSTTRGGYLLLEDLEEGDYVLRTTAGPAYEEARTPVRVSRAGSEVRVVLVPRAR